MTIILTAQSVRLLVWFLLNYTVLGGVVRATPFSAIAEPFSFVLLLPPPFARLGRVLGGCCVFVCLVSGSPSLDPVARPRSAPCGCPSLRCGLIGQRQKSMACSHFPRPPRSHVLPLSRAGERALGKRRLVNKVFLSSFLFRARAHS